MVVDSVGFSLQWHSKVKRGPFPGFTFGPDVSGMGLNNMFHDGKSKTRSAEFLGPPFVHTIKPFKNPVEILFWDSHAIVLDGDPNLLASRPDGRDCNLTAFPTVFDGIVDQIDKNLFEMFSVATNEKGRGEVTPSD